MLGSTFVKTMQLKFEDAIKRLGFGLENKSHDLIMVTYFLYTQYSFCFYFICTVENNADYDFKAVAVLSLISSAQLYWCIY